MSAVPLLRIYDARRNQYYDRNTIKYVMNTMVQARMGTSHRRGHECDSDLIRPALLKAFENIRSDFKCQCGHPGCDEVMTLCGTNAISPDRKYDDLGYHDEGQVLTFVCKEHNTRIKHDTVPKELTRRSPLKWYNMMASGIIAKTRERIEKLRTLGDQITAYELEQVKRYYEEELDSTFDRRDIATNMVKQMKQESTECAKCHRDLYFGDDEGNVRFSYLGHKASADRIDNQNVFYDSSNVRLVCISCNHNDNPTRRTLKNENPTTEEHLRVPLTQDIIQECIQYLLPIAPITEKTCKTCNKSKPAVEFEQSGRKKLDCQSCHSQQKKERYNERYKVAAQKQAKEYYVKNKVKMNEVSRQYHANKKAKTSTV
jgi:hypothetical protein